MSQFHPTNVTVDPPPMPDYFGAAVLQALSRPIGAPLSWGVVKSIFWAVVTFGLWPLVAGVTAQCALAQGWPAKRVKVLVPLAAGSTADIVSLFVGTELAKRLGHPVVV